MGTDSVIYIRTDGNSKIATGHLVRCLCIAQALESLGKSICFLVSDEDSFSLLQDLAASIFDDYSFSFDVKILETAKYNDLESEIEELSVLLTPSAPFLNSPTTLPNADNSSLPGRKILHKDNLKFMKPVIFVDSYFVTEHYFACLSEFAKVAYMDDLRAFDYKFDLIVNYDVIPPSKEQEYELSYTNAGVSLLGAGYTPLRRQFQKQEVSLRSQIKNILVTTGGSDPYDFTSTLSDHLLFLKLDVEIHVVVGRLFKNVDSLEELAKQHSSLHLHYNVSDMASLMKQCDYAVSAAGTTLYELCALGIPSISISMADNQIPMAETFAEADAVPYAGDIRVQKVEDMNEILGQISQHLISLCQDMSGRQLQHQKMRQLVDGNGAIKIAEKLCKL